MNEENSHAPSNTHSVEMTAAIDIVQETMDKFLDAAKVTAVYGRPIKNGDTLIIPTAEVISGMGFGIGFGTGSSSDDNEETGPSAGAGGGGGGGGRVLSRPVAVVIASPEGVRVEPVVDTTKIALAALTAGGFMMGMLVRMMRFKGSSG